MRVIDENLLSHYSEDIPFFLKRIYAARGVLEQSLDLSLKHLLKPDFPDLAKALSRLETALLKQEQILIVGDFDADGATSCALAIRALRRMGAQQVDFLVPNRFEHGYGLSTEIVELAFQRFKPTVIITVDNGIVSFDGVLLANQYGIDVIITDHHLPQETLPNALAIINPNLKHCKFASKHLAGVGVCFYLFSALKTYLKGQNYFTQALPEPNLIDLLDLVALGTIADVVKLDKNNRILVSKGMRLVREKRCCVGILALFEVANREPDNASAQDFGFAIAPRLNAAGRMDDITYGVRCLLTDDLSLARQYVNNLESFNKQRKTLQATMQQQADEIVSQQDEKQNSKQKYSICLYQSDWHEGIVGIIAGRLKEKYHCPSIVFADAQDDYLKGSARSIASVHIKDLLDNLAIQEPKLMDKFGGHAMAAGLLIKRQNLAKFSQCFDQAVEKWLNGCPPDLVLVSDGILTDEEISLDNAQLLEQSGPWGNGFELPLFQGDFHIAEQIVMAEKHLKLYLHQNNPALVFSAVAFNQAPLKQKKVTLLYQLMVNRYRKQSSLQLLVCHILQ